MNFKHSFHIERRCKTKNRLFKLNSTKQLDSHMDICYFNFKNQKYLIVSEKQKFDRYHYSIFVDSFLNHDYTEEDKIKTL